jgi:hypothetical protein
MRASRPFAETAGVVSGWNSAVIAVAILDVTVCLCEIGRGVVIVTGQRLQVKKLRLEK